MVDLSTIQLIVIRWFCGNGLWTFVAFRWNKRVAELTGIPGEQVIGKDYRLASQQWQNCRDIGFPLLTMQINLSTATKPSRTGTVITFFPSLRAKLRHAMMSRVLQRGRFIMHGLRNAPCFAITSSMPDAELLVRSLMFFINLYNGCDMISGAAAGATTCMIVH